MRDGAKAVELATKACELSDWKHREMIATLAAACAEAGDWASAVERQQQAIELAVSAKEKKTDQQRFQLYEQHKPFRDDSTDVNKPREARPQRKQVSQ